MFLSHTFCSDTDSCSPSRIVSLCRFPLWLQSVPLHRAECCSGLDGNLYCHRLCRANLCAEQITVTASCLRQLLKHFALWEFAAPPVWSLDVPFIVVLSLKARILPNIFKTALPHREVASDFLPSPANPQKKGPHFHLFGQVHDFVWDFQATHNYYVSTACGIEANHSYTKLEKLPRSLLVPGKLLQSMVIKIFFNF